MARNFLKEYNKRYKKNLISDNCLLDRDFLKFVNKEINYERLKIMKEKEKERN